MLLTDFLSPWAEPPGESRSVLSVVLRPIYLASASLLPVAVDLFFFSQKLGKKKNKHENLFTLLSGVLTRPYRGGFSRAGGKAHSQSWDDP